MSHSTAHLVLSSGALKKAFQITERPFYDYFPNIFPSLRFTLLR